MSDTKWGIINRAGEIVLPIKFEFLFDVSETGILPVCVDKSFRYIRLDGSPAFEGVFEMAYPFREGFALAQRGGLYGMINEQGQTVVEFEFDQCGQFYCGLALVKKGSKYGYIDQSGKIAIPLIYRSANAFSDGLGCVCNDEGKWGYVNTSGDLQIDHRFQSSEDFSEGLAFVTAGERKGYIDGTGEIVITPNGWSSGQQFSEGLACVYGRRRGNHTFGDCFIDRSGAFVFEECFESAFGFSEGRALIKVKKKYGFIDRSGETIIAAKYEHAHSFRGGVAIVTQNEADGCIDLNGNVVIPFQYNNICGPKNGYFRVAVEEPLDEASKAAALTLKRIDMVWQLNVEGYMEVDEIQEQLEEQYELKVTRKEVRDLMKCLLGRVEFPSEEDERAAYAELDQDDDPEEDFDEA
jgi:hypothetical protein